MMLHEDEFGCPAMPKVMALEAWKSEHRPHLWDARARGQISEAAFTEEPYPHPSGTWVSTVCVCGAKHVRDSIV